MVEQEIGSDTDLLLRRFLESSEEAASEQLLGELVEGFVPLVKDIVGYKLRSSTHRSGRADTQESEDVCSDAVTQLLSRLRELKRDEKAPRIENFRSYVAVAAYHACAEHLRRKYPYRYRLKHKLRYVLTHQSQLSFWETETGEWVGGFSAWQRDWAQSQETTRRLSEFRDNPRVISQPVSKRGRGLPDLLMAIFETLAQPVELDALVGMVAEILGIKDQTDQPTTERGEDRTAVDDLTDERHDAARELEQKRYLECLWSEVEQMSPRHAAALLLNLRDGKGGSALELFAFTGVATFRQIAGALTMTEEALAEIWNDLPLDDSTIATRIDATRQQVVNLRKSARERLTRRLKAAGH